MWKCRRCQHSKQKEVHIFLSMVKGKSIGFYTKSLRLSFSSVQLLNRVRLFATPWTAAWQAALCITNSQSLLRVMSTESVMPSNHLILCWPLLLPPSIFPSIRVFSSESVLHIRWMQSSHLNAEFQRISRRDKKAFLSDQCKEIEENNRMGKTRDLFKKIRDTKGTFHAKMGTIRDRNYLA